MKWVSHKAVTASLVYAVTGAVLPVIPAVVGSVVPDSLEGRSGPPGTARYRVWAKRHRGMSHWFVPYAVLALACLLPAWRAGTVVPTLSGAFLQGPYLVPTFFGLAFWFFAGCLLHLLEDLFSGRIPGLNPYGRRVGVRLIPVGGLGEIVVVLAAVVSAFLVRGLGGVR